MENITEEMINEAKIQAMTGEPVGNYMRIYLSYSTELILPYKDGLALMATLEKAELLKGNYGNETIGPINHEALQARIMSRIEYIDRKTAALLNVPYKEYVESSKEDKDE